MKGNLGSEWEVSPSEGPGDGEPRRSTKKYMALGGREQRREKKKISKGPGVGATGAARRGRDRGGWVCQVTAGERVCQVSATPPSVTNRAVTKPCERTERGEFLGERAGVSEGAWWSEQGGSCDWALRAPAWWWAVPRPPATGAGDGPLVPP